MNEKLSEISKYKHRENDMSQEILIIFRKISREKM